MIWGMSTTLDHKPTLGIRKKKEPRRVKENLLNATAQVVIERGLAGITLELVAQKAGVSKGGLLHHFSCKQSLIEGLCDRLLADFEEAMNASVADDPDPRGRFYRAYVKATVAPQKTPNNTKLFGAFALAMSHDDRLSDKWRDWFKNQAEKHGADLNSALGGMIRYAADGIWMEQCIGVFVTSAAKRQAIADYLIKMSYDI